MPLTSGLWLPLAPESERSFSLCHVLALGWMGGGPVLSAAGWWKELARSPVIPLLMLTGAKFSKIGNAVCQFIAVTDVLVGRSLCRPPVQSLAQDYLLH